MEETTDNQRKNSVPKELQPYCFKKGQSGNPAGRPKGFTLKDYCKDFLQKQTEEERQEFLEGIPKETIWKMAEGNPETKGALEHTGTIQFIVPKELAPKNGITSTPSDNS